MNPFLSDQIQATRDLIDSEPSSIALHRAGTYVRTASGGQVKTDSAATLTAVNRFMSAVSGQENFFFQEQGQNVRVRWVLVGLPGDDIRPEDTFSLNGMEFRILYVVDETRAYETRAYVERTDG